MSTIRIAVVGLGMGKLHVAGYLKHPGAEVVAVADLDESRFAAIREMVPGIRTYVDYREMLRVEKPALVSVAVPNSLHEEISCAALESGADVLCEKPMSVDLPSALRMRDKAETTGRKLYINFSQRFGAFGRTARSLVDAGELGPIYHAYCQWTRRDGIPRFGGWFGRKEMSGGGPLIDLGVHRLDFVFWLMGDAKPLTVSAVTHDRLGTALGRKHNKPFDVEDLATGLIRTDSGASILFDISWTGFQVKKEQQVLRLLGEKGSIEGSPGPHGDYTLYFCHNLAGNAYNSTPVDPTPEASSFETLVDCLLTGDPFPATTEDGIRLQAVLDALYESARVGREIEVDALQAHARG